MFTESEFEALTSFINVIIQNPLWPGEDNARVINILGTKLSVCYNTYYQGAKNCIDVRADEWSVSLGFGSGFSFMYPSNKLTGDRAIFEKDLLLIKMVYE